MFELAGCVLLNAKSELLLLYRPSRDQWELPGGKVELGEELEETVKREIREELLCDVALNPAPIGNSTFEEDGNKMHYTWYRGDILNGQTPKIGEPHKFNDLKYFSLKNMPQNLSPNMRNLYQKILNREVQL